MLNKLKKTLAMILAGTAFMSMAACGQSTSDSVNSSVDGNVTMQTGMFDTKTYSSGERFVFFSDLPPNANLQALTTYKEAGFTDFNLIPWAAYGAGFNKDAENLNSTQFAGALALLNELDLGVYVRGFGTLDSIQQFDKFDFSKYDAFKGFYVVDEPARGAVKRIGEEIVPYYNEKYAHTEDAFWHLNLFPSYASESMIGKPNGNKSSFECYVDDYVEYTLSKVEGPKSIGVDHYGMRARGKDYFISDTYLYDLMIVANAAKKTGAHMSNCMQTSSGHTNTRVIQYASELRWQYYTSMAFGTRRFQAFGYQDALDINFHCMYGTEPHDLYYFHQEVSAELKKFQDVFLSFDWEGVDTVLGTENERGFSSSFDFIEKWTLPSLHGVKEITATQDTLVGQFDCDGDKAFMIVNNTDPVFGILDTVTLQFENCNKAMVYRGGKLYKYTFTNNTMQLPLIGGEGVFVIPVIES